MNQSYKYSMEFEITLGEAEPVIIGVYKWNIIPSSGRDRLLCNDPEDCQEIIGFEYDILDARRNIINHLKKSMRPNEENEIELAIIDFLKDHHYSRMAPVYTHNGVIQE